MAAARRTAPDASVERCPAGLALVVALLVAVTVLDQFLPGRSFLVIGPVVAVGLVLLARRCGLGWPDLGLARRTWRRGVRWALVASGAVAASYGVAAAVPALRPGLRDVRYQSTAPYALLTAFVIIPVGTVLLEEVAFRGVLWGWIRRDYGTRPATAWSSVLFGLWHVLPSLQLNRTNQAVESVAGAEGTGQVLAVIAAVVFTGLSGVLLCELRRRSGSLLAPVGLHWAANGFGVLAVAAIGALEGG